jgi:predicted Rossmann-fold nucleotide-binding protein
VLYLVRYNGGMIALPGGIGTLSEVALTWNSLQVGEIAPVPLILLGFVWNKTIHAFNDPQYIGEQHLGFLTFSETAETAVAHLRDHHSTIHPA